MLSRDGAISREEAVEWLKNHVSTPRSWIFGEKKAQKKSCGIEERKKYDKISSD